VLADDALVQVVFHAQQLRSFGFGELLHWHARPFAHNRGDVVFGDFGLLVAVFLGALRLPRFLSGVEFFLKFARFVAQFGGFFVFVVIDLRLPWRYSLRPVRASVRALPWAEAHAQFNARTRFVNEVNRFVGQLAIGDVALRQFNASLSASSAILTP
jgi:hypothetical protein